MYKGAKLIKLENLILRLGRILFDLNYQQETLNFMRLKNIRSDQIKRKFLSTFAYALYDQAFRTYPQIAFRLSTENFHGYPLALRAKTLYLVT